MESRPVIQFSDESQSSRLAKKAKEEPFVPIGIAGCVGAVAYGIYQYKNRGEMSTSVYLMRFRVIAQSAVVLTLGLGISYSMFMTHVLPKFKSTNAIVENKDKHPAV